MSLVIPDLSHEMSKLSEVRLIANAVMNWLLRNVTSQIWLNYRATFPELSKVRRIANAVTNWLLRDVIVISDLTIRAAFPEHSKVRRIATGWCRCIGCHQLQVSFCKRAIIYGALLQKMAYICGLNAIATGWRRCRGCIQLQVSSRKRTTDYRALLFAENDL